MGFPGGTMVKNPPAGAGDARDGSSPLGGKSPWSREWQPTPGLLPGESHAQRSLGATVHRVAESQIELSACARARAHTHTHRTLIVIFQKDMGGQQVHEIKFSITNHQGNANQNHSEVSPHTYKNGCY